MHQSLLDETDGLREREKFSILIYVACLNRFSEHFMRQLSLNVWTDGTSFVEILNRERELMIVEYKQASRPMVGLNREHLYISL